MTDVAPAVTGSLTLAGRLVDNTGAAVSDADVFLYGTDLSTHSGADGTFAFHALAPGSWYSLVARKGELRAVLSVPRHEHAYEPLTIQMVRGHTLVVHAVELDGHTPIANATVTTDENQSAVTDADGTATIEGTAAAVLVAVHAHGHGGVAKSTYNPTTNQDKDATVLSVVAELPPGAPISGTVIDPTGAPVANATVYIATIDTATWHRDAEPIHTDEHGAWQLDGIAAGTYAITATSRDLTTASATRIAADGSTERTGIVVHTAYGAQLVGRVTRHGRPATDSVAVLSDFGHRYTAHTDDHGEFALLGVPAGTYQIAAWGSAQASKTYSIALVRDRRIVVELPEQDTRIAGTIVDTNNHPVGNAIVNVRSVDDAPTLWSFSDRTDATGHFDVGGVPVGRYHVALSANGHEVATVLVTSGNRHVNLTLPGLTKITGRVVLDDGAPVQTFGFLVNEDREMLLDTNWRAFPRFNTVDGRFAKDRVRAGRRLIVIAGESFEAKEIEVDIPEGNVFDLGDITVEARARRLTHPRP